MPDARIARWIGRELRRRPPKAKSLVVTVWGDAIGPWRYADFIVLPPAEFAAAAHIGDDARAGAGPCPVH